MVQRRLIDNVFESLLLLVKVFNQHLLKRLLVIVEKVTSLEPGVLSVELFFSSDSSMSESKY